MLRIYNPRIRMQILTIIAENKPTVYELNEIGADRGWFKYKNVHTLRNHIYELINTGSIVPEYKEEEKVTRFKITYQLT